jgi:manganese transport protein
VPPATRGRTFRLLGPAFVAAVAYVDPGNVGTNVAAGARYGYSLVWVVVVANLTAILVQFLAAKLGIVTQLSLAGHLRRRLPRGARIAYWLQAEAVAAATDMAEVVGGAIALAILFQLPLVVGAVCTVAVSLVILRIGDVRGQPALERVIMGFLALIAVGFTVGLFVHPPDGGQVAGGLVPSFSGRESVLLASGIIGATMMPHVIYLHSSLTTSRLGARGHGFGVRRLLAVTRADVVLALLVAGLLNLSILMVAATSLSGQPRVETLAGVHSAIATRLGSAPALLFALALLGSGLASTSVGSAAGAEVLNGLLDLRAPRVVRQLITGVPAVVLLAAGADPSRTLVISQVVLSMGIPFALIPLVVLTSRRSVMGPFANGLLTTASAVAVVSGVIVLNLVLLYLTLSGSSQG